MLFDFAELDLREKGELYRTLYRKIKEACECGAIKKGEKLPSVREAAAMLSVSRTTVENAYTRLCIEGLAESRPQRGYFLTGAKVLQNQAVTPEEKPDENIKYDFSSRRIDVATADTEIWKKLVRSVLWDSNELISYGDPQGEFGLRAALSSYVYKARGVRTAPENIVIGAGIGPLLNILCGLLGTDIKVGFENGGFSKAKSIFSDYNIETEDLKCDNNGATPQEIEKKDIDILFLMPSALSKISVTAISKRRNEFSNWAREKDKRFIIEDDYNGELRYTARSLPAFQGKETEKTIYIGSFSKLLLPSVRIAYMVLPPSLTKMLQDRKAIFDQTCGKIDQLALKKYILSGALEKHLKRLRRIYYNKSQILIGELKKKLPDAKISIYETSLTVDVETKFTFDSEEIYKKALSTGIKIIPTQKEGCLRLCFAGIAENDISQAVTELCEILK